MACLILPTPEVRELRARLVLRRNNAIRERLDARAMPYVVAIDDARKADRALLDEPPSADRDRRGRAIRRKLSALLDAYGPLAARIDSTQRRGDRLASAIHRLQALEASPCG